MASEHTITKIVEYAHTDMAGIVHHAEFFNYMEEVEHAFLRSLELSVIMTDGGRKISWPRVSCSFDFKKPLRFEDEFELHLSVKSVGTKSITYEVDVILDGEVIAAGRSTSVCCEMLEGRSMRSIEIPGLIRDRVSESPCSGTP